jgi:dTDP-4-amino-4,6-dideoxygalactose transaminase
MSLPFLPFARQSIIEEDLDAVQEALKGDHISGGGPLVEQFEQQIASYCDVPFTVLFQTGTAALMAAYFAAELSLYDRVISSPLADISTVASPCQQRIRLKFVDIERSTGHINQEKLKVELNYSCSRGRPFIVPFHFAGLAVDMQKLDGLIKHPDAVVIEDASHAIGSCYPTGERIGSCAYSQMTTFNFDSSRTLTTGEGGVVTTRDPALHHRLLLFRDNGIERGVPYLKKKTSEAEGYYEVQAITGNFHMTDFQAALGLSQLSRLDRFIGKRRHLVQCYRQCLKEIPHLKLMTEEQDGYTAFHLMAVQIDFNACGKTRLEVMRRLKERGIGTKVHDIPLYHHPVFKYLTEEEEFSETEAYYQQTLSLPLYYDLTDEDVQRVCRELKEALFIS